MSWYDSAPSAERRLGKVLVERRLITVDDLERFSAEAVERSVPLTRLLIDAGRVTPGEVLDVAAEELHIPRAELDDGVADPSLVTLLDADVAERLQALPYARDEAGHVLVAVADPLDEAKRREVSLAIGAEVRFALAERDRLAEAIAVAYGRVPVADGGGPGRPHVNELLDVLVEMGGSDLHLTAGSHPQARLDGQLVPLDGYGVLKPAPLRAMVYEVLTSRQRQQLEDERELDFSHPMPGRGRFRVSVFFQRGSIGMVMRAIPNEVVPLDELGMPPAVARFAELQRGLVLVTGPTGSGKTTTLAAVIDLINSTRSGHVITVEDPIEFIHRHKRCIVNQREVGSDTLSFAAALRHALRQDPDVILVGEMRDLETISTAITAAETGHLVLATLHTQNAPKSVERIIDVFPAHAQHQVRVQLASSLQGVVAQQLVPAARGNGRVAAAEVMVATPAIRNLIREGKLHQIHTAMQAGGRYGMQTMDQALAELVRAGKVELSVALERAHDPDSLRALVPDRLR